MKKEGILFYEVKEEKKKGLYMSCEKKKIGSERAEGGGNEDT